MFSEPKKTAIITHGINNSIIVKWNVGYNYGYNEFNTEQEAISWCKKNNYKIINELR